MANISIFEKDVSNIPSTVTNNNVVYVPGYAIMGPVNKPVLCTTLRQFQETFGTEPYTFEENQTYESLGTYINKGTLPNTNFALANTKELSYYYVTELLNQGLFVLFERIFDEEKKCYAKIEIPFFSETGTLIQVEALPEANASNLGLIVQYIGETTAEAPIYTQGKFYKCEVETIETVDTYSWNLITDPTNNLIVESKYPGKFYKDMNVNLSYDAVKGVYTIIPSYELTIDGIKRFQGENNLHFSFNPTSEYFIGGYDDTTKEFVDFKSEYLRLSFDGNYSDIAGKVVWNYNGKLIEGEIENEFEVVDIYKAMSTGLFDKLTDRGEYELKFISSGAYPTFYYNESLTKDTDAAKNYKIAKDILINSCKRGDAIGLIDYLADMYSKIEGIDSKDASLYRNSLFSNINKILSDASDYVVEKKQGNEDARSYGTMLAPYSTYNSNITKGLTFKLPTSFGYLISLAKSIQWNPNWYAIAGVTRGVVDNLATLNYNMTGAIADSLQVNTGVSINPITNIKPYGFTIWGNRTLVDNSGEIVATSLLNVRSLACDVKKAVYVAARKFMFEPVSEILWLNFKSEIEPLLDKMISGNGLTNYKIIRKETTEKATISVLIRLYVVEPVENFDVTIEISDSYIEVQ